MDLLLPGNVLVADEGGNARDTESTRAQPSLGCREMSAQPGGGEERCSQRADQDLHSTGCHRSPAADIDADAVKEISYKSDPIRFHRYIFHQMYISFVFVHCAQTKIFRQQGPSRMTHTLHASIVEEPLITITLLVTAAQKENKQETELNLNLRYLFCICIRE